MSLIGANNAEKIWNFLINKINNPYGVAGLMGNLDCESGLKPNNLEDGCAVKNSLSDENYTQNVDIGVYKNFVNDGFGYGLAQWTWPSRKEGLLNFAKERKTSIGDLETQLLFLFNELESNFKPVLNFLKLSSSVVEASNFVLVNFEKPIYQTSGVKLYRAQCGQRFYDRFSCDLGGKIKMGYITTQKGKSTKVSKDFDSKEFDCHGNGCCSTTVINQKLVEYVQKIRDHFNSPITVTSGYRCKTHNAKVGGATGSRHSLGDAADIVVQGHTPAEVAKYAESIGIKGIGLYETVADGYFVHIDTRDYKSFWYGQKQQGRTTFGGNPDSSTTSQASANILKYGDKGEAIKKLQKKLLDLGYSCGAVGIDGVYGLATMQAVKKFQKDAGFSLKEQDGICGEKTFAILNEAVVPEASSTYIVNAAVLNIRSEPNTSSSIVGGLAKGTICKVTEQKDGWGKIQQGWVHMAYLKKKEVSDG